jgi:hypothetical protein
MWRTICPDVGYRVGHGIYVAGVGRLEKNRPVQESSGTGTSSISFVFSFFPTL